MKKLLPILLLFVAVLISHHLDAQTVGSTRIHFNDNTNKDYFPLPEMVIRNTDSANHSSPFTYHSTNYIPFGYNDSFSWDSTNLDSAISIHYYACGQWYTLDTFYSVYRNAWFGGTFYYLDISINLPCTRPCDAGFTYEQYSPGYFNFYGANAGSGGSHFWDFGNGQTSTGAIPYVNYATPGIYAVKHVIHDPSRSCSDSTTDSISVGGVCNGTYTYTDLNNLTIEFTAQNGNAYSHLWIINGDTVPGGNVVQYTFPSDGNYWVSHTSSFQSSCSHTVSGNVWVRPCRVELDTIISQNQVTFIPTDSTRYYFYVFGDGDSSYHQGSFTHTYPGPGNYNATVKDSANPCQITYLNLFIPFTCNFTFNLKSPALNVLRATGQSVSFLSSRYIINTTDTLYGDSIDYSTTSAGAYTVRRELFDQNGIVQCFSNQTMYFNSCGFGSTAGYYPTDIRGRVIFNNQYVTNYGALRIYLIVHDTINATLTAIDSLDLTTSTPDSGYFNFSQVCSIHQKFLVKAALLSSSSIYSSYMPTYYPNSTTWSNAIYINIGNYGTINMTAGTNPGGSGFIGGLISQGANKNFTPLEGIQVNLFNEQEDPVAYTFSTSDGSYAFNDLAYGKYKVVVEVLGRSSSFYWVTLDADNPKSEEKDFEVNSTYVSLLSSVKPQLRIVSRIYPNPTDDILYIDWNEVVDETITIQLMSIDGKLLKTITKAPGDDLRTELSLDELSQGLYILTLSGKQGMSTFQIQKN